MFAGESVIDELAQRVGMDPIDFRLKECCTGKVPKRHTDPKFQAIGVEGMLARSKNPPKLLRER